MAKSLPARSDVVIIGGGIVGTSIAYHLGKIGITNTVVLERKQLTSGTTWHAAGLVGQLRASRNLTELAKYTTSLFEGLEKETGRPPASSRMARSRSRSPKGDGGTKARRLHGQEFRPRGRVITTAEIKERMPHYNLDGVGRRVPAEGRPGESDRCDPGAGRRAPGSMAPRSSRNKVTRSSSRRARPSASRRRTARSGPTRW